MTREEIISGLQMTMDLFLFDPTTGKTTVPDMLNDIDRETYDACKGAIEALKAQDVTDTNVGNDDLISRQMAIRVASGYCHPANIAKELAKLPAAEPERKTGMWLADNRPGGGFWVCSCCKFPSEAFAADVLYKFCPNCGAEMREGREE